ncbi:MAG TPA: 50S ribosomal protein L11 methyltransferase [Allosphingosinicella sp.]|nr:50S ribosomal protein L11 methyltransferase [Allosphingosinicella sp.]
MDYAQLPAHRWMLRDQVRTAAFQEAIAAVVRPGDVVLDVGAGSGILSMFAAKAGARQVIGVELEPIASLAAQLVGWNGLADRVTIFQGDVRSLQLAEKADVLVSEWMGTIGVDENMLGAVLWARDHLLKPGGRMIPATVEAVLAPVATSLRPDSGFFHRRPYDLELGPLAEDVVNELFMLRRQIRAKDIAAPPQRLWVTDTRNDPPTVVRQPYEATLGFVLRKRAKVSALAAWFRSDLGGGVVLTNAPDAPETHWGQLMLPLDREMELARGARLDVRVSARVVGPGPLMFRWAVRVDGGAWEEHDTGAPAKDAAPPPEPERSPLCGFLADLAVDPDRLFAFYSDPDAEMTRAGLDPAFQAALKSRRPEQIAHGLYRRAAQS